VRLDGTTPVSGVSMQMNSSPTKLTTTAANGTYTFTGVAPGSYVIRAVKSTLTFVDQPVVVTNASVTGVNFTANR
jgi:protocatechuate 3,4-dioxygenase beta subunit